MYICEFCGRSFLNVRAISKHLQKKSKGPCRCLYIEKYGESFNNFPWNKRIQCKTIGCSNLTWRNSKTGLCSKCASEQVTKNRSRNAKLTVKNKKFVKDGKVNWECEFCKTSFYTKGKLNSHAKNSKCSPKFYEKYRIQALFPWNNYSGTDYCINCGKAIPVPTKLCRSCSATRNMKNNRRPSKPQLQLFKIVKVFFPDAILEMLCNNFYIDIAIPEIKVAIEYDGSYWHQDKEQDKVRQRKLEGEGWKFVRYVDKIPSEKQLIQDVSKVVNPIDFKRKVICK